jgi:hypothetical protein
VKTELKARPGCKFCRYCEKELSSQGMAPHEANCTFKKVLEAKRG